MTLQFNPLKQGFKNHAIDWQRCEVVTLDEWKKRQDAKPKRRRKNGKA